MQGRRIPDGLWRRYERGPGDYGLTGGGLWVVLPSGVEGRLDPEDWDWREEPDGSLSVTPSIHDAPNGWHGHLTKGVWEP